MRGELHNSEVRSRPSTSRVQFSFFLLSALASTAKSPLTPSLPPAQDICEQIPPPSFRSLPFVFVFLFQVTTTNPVACVDTDAGVSSRGGVVFFDGR